MSLTVVCAAPYQCVCLADCFTQSSDIPRDSSELFTVPRLSASGKEREGVEGKVGRGSGEPRQKSRME